MEQHALLHGEIIVGLAVALVRHANLELVERREHIQLGERDIGQAVNLCGIAGDNRVEPAATALAPGGHAVLVALGAHQVAVDGVLALAAVFGIDQLGGERTGANTCNIGLLDAQHAVDGSRTHAGTRSRAARAARGAGHKRIRTVVDIEQRALRALEQNMLALTQRVVQKLRGFCHVGTNDLGIRQIRVADFIHGERALAVHLLQDGVLHLERRLHLHAEHVLVHQILDADAAAGGFVLIARADAAVGGSDFVFTQLELGRLVQLDMVGHDHVSIAGDLQALAGQALALQHAHLLNQHLRVHHHTVADNRHRVLVHDTRRNKVQCELLIAVNHRVAGVVSALVAHHVVEVAGNEVGHLSLAFVTPLGSDQHHVRHVRLSFFHILNLKRP